MNKDIINIKVEQWVKETCNRHGIETLDRKYSFSRREAIFERYWIYIIRYDKKIIDTLKIDTRIIPNEKNRSNN